jgi:hypothetical protein
MRANHSKIFFSIIIAYCCSACSENEYLLYDVNQQDAVFLDMTELTDSVYYNFGFYEITEYIYHLPVLLMGMPRDYDREFRVSLNNGLRADSTVVPAIPAYYEVPEKITLKRDSVVAYVPIKLLRHQDLETIRTILTIQIEPSEDFEVRGHSKFTISFDDLTPPTPIWWTSWDMGAFTKFKGQLFFRYFFEMQQESPVTYNNIVSRWGKFLDIPPNNAANSPLNVYRIAFNKFVKLKMYHFSIEHPELNLNISYPVFK